MNDLISRISYPDVTKNSEGNIENVSVATSNRVEMCLSKMQDPHYRVRIWFEISNLLGIPKHLVVITHEYIELI
jgi:hypothetical protein